MTIRSFFFICCMCLGFYAQPANAQTLSAPVNIEFGQMVVGGIGTVTIPSSSDTRNATGSIALVGSVFIQRGSITVTHTPGAQVTISVPTSIVMAGANAPTLTPTIEGGNVQTIPAGGVMTVYFGGTITFPTFGAYGAASTTIPVNIDPF